MASSTQSPSLMDALFQRSLEDIIKNLRQNQATESIFISRALDEIRREIKSTDLHTKSVALQKLNYLNSLYFVDMSWAAFHAIECISSPNFCHKKIGYLSISQSFSEDSPMILLISNQLRKDLKSGNEFEVSLALECLSRIGNVDLCRDLTSEVFTLMASSRVFVRKKAIGVVLRVFERYPDAVRVCFKRVVENLESSDAQVLSAAVGVFCELCCNDPKTYLPLAPEFHKILVDSRNNWVLIKVLKIFAKLVPLEPRLAKRVVEPISDLMRRTGAKSLIFECIKTVVSSFSEYESLVKLAASKIREFLMDDDLNLKYLGLHGLAIMTPKHLWAVLENKEVVIKSLSDIDPNVRLESLKLVMAMVSQDNVEEICRVLVSYALKSDPDFCNEILGSILSTCSRNVYDVIVDFDWYVSLLGEMVRIPHCQKGEEIENQLVDIGMRVKDVRPALVRVSRDLLIDPALLGNSFLHRVLSAAAWVCGEYVEFSSNPIELMEALLQPRTSLLPPSIRSVYLHSAFKGLVFCLDCYYLEQEALVNESMLDEPALLSNKTDEESLDISTQKALTYYEENDNLKPMDSNKSPTDVSTEDGGNGLMSSSAFLEKKRFTQQSIVKLLSLIEKSLSPLLQSHDVEVLERARNVLGLVQLIKQEMFDNVDTKDTKIASILEMIRDAFSEDLGPVSLSAQEKVSVPDGLVLKENLADLDDIRGIIDIPSKNWFSTSFYHGDSAAAAASASGSGSNFVSKEESEPSSESTSLLVEHRKRHGLYYLPSDKNVSPVDDYPPANEPKSESNDDAPDLAKLADQLLKPKRKANRPWSRPVVVKLDEGDVVPITSKKTEIKVDLLSGAIREILLGNEAKPNDSQSNPSKKSTGQRKGKEKLVADLPESEKADHGNSSSRKSKHRSHGKERRNRSPGKKNADDGEDKEEEKQRRHRHGKNKTRQRDDNTAKVVPQASVIPDFLL